MKSTKIIFFIAVPILAITITIYMLLPIKHFTFNSLTSLQKYAAHFPESPKSDNKYWKNPRYGSFYKKYYSKSFVEKMMIKMGLQTHYELDLTALTQLLKKVTTCRIKNKLKSPFDKMLTRIPGDRCFIWGDLHGAFHSMVKNLSQLKKMKIIDENLKIIKKNVTFIFLGDAISRSPYCLELLNTILLLLDNNPQKVFYLRGNQEKNKHWEDFSMAEALLFKNGFKKINIDIPNKISKDFNQFFKTLPDYLEIQENKGNEKIICTHSNLKESFLSNHDIKIILSGEQRFSTIRDTPGLFFLGFNRGISQWSILSCPVQIYQQFFNFHYDAFVELTIGPTISQSVLTLFNNDIRNPTKFNKTYYEAIFGYPLKNKKSDIQEKNIIRIGSTLALEGAGKVFNKELKAGFDLAVSTFNKATSKNLIKPVFLDDAYKPNKALQNVLTLYNKYKINTLIMPTGTPTLEKYLHMATSGKIAILFPITGAMQFRKPSVKNLINFRASYKEEVKSLMNYFIKKQNISHFAFFYPEDSFGKPIANAAHQILQKNGITKWLDLPYTKTQVNFDPIVEKLKANAPDTIGFFANFYQTIRVINKFGSEFLFDRTIFGLSDLNITPFKIFIKDIGTKMLNTHVVPNPKTSNILIAKEFRSLVKKRKIIISDDLFEGYISGSLLIDAINHLKPPFTNEKFIKYFEKLKNYNFKGLRLTFNPEKRDLSQKVHLRWFE